MTPWSRLGRRRSAKRTAGRRQSQMWRHALEPLESRCLLDGGGLAGGGSHPALAVSATTVLAAAEGPSEPEAFTHADRALDPGDLPADGGDVVQAEFVLAGWRWPDHAISFGYYVYTGGRPSGIGESAFVAAIDNAFGVWEDVSSTFIKAHRIGFGTARAPGAADGVVTVGFGTAVPGALAHATTWYGGSITTEFDVTLGDDRATWSTSPSGGQVDVWATAAHEIGHGLGLGHTGDSSATMYPAIFIGSTHQRDPNGDDIGGLESLYPKGDMNGDGAVNASDIDAFRLAFTDPGGYDGSYPSLSRILRGDLNDDAALNVADVAPFQDLLLGKGVPASQVSTLDDLRDLRTARISGFLWHDVDRDNARGADDLPLSGWQVYLDGNRNGRRDGGEPMDTTDGAGAYTFGQLAAGTYRVRVVTASGWTIKVPVSGSRTLTLAAGQTRNGANFGIVSPAIARITGVLWEDLDHDGRRELAEPVLSGWRVYQDVNDNGVRDGHEITGTTGTRGGYTLMDVATGSHAVRVVTPFGWEGTAPGNAARSVSVDTGATRDGIDFGLARGLLPRPDAIRFAGSSIVAYAAAAAAQDVDGGHELRHAGVTLRLTGNTWKAAVFAYDVTPQTVLSFDFQSAAEGEIHGIGVDDDLLFNNGSPVEIRFDLHGTQSIAVANHDFDDYAGPGPRHYEIPLGQFLTGPIAYLTFVNDHDVAVPDAQSLFSSVRLLEGPRADVQDFRQAAVRSYQSAAGAQDLGGAYDVRDAGASLHLSGNAWKAADFAYVLTERTILSFDFQSVAEGEIHGIGVDDDLTFNNGSPVEARFDLYGTQSVASSNHDFGSYGASAPGVRHYEIPVGRYLTGAVSYLTFVNDHDVADPASESLFSNVRMVEGTVEGLDFRGLTPSSYASGSEQDIAGATTVADAGVSLHLQGNTWKARAFAYDVTPHTVLAFDFSSAAEGEIHGIGVDDDLTFNNGSPAEIRFDLHGTQTLPAANHQFNDYRGPHERHFEIPIGTFVTGRIGYLTFVCDHDVPEPDALSVFSRVRLVERDTHDASIAGTVWDDGNRDGERDGDERGVAGLSVLLDADGNGSFDAGEPSAMTGAAGTYRFTDLAAGTYGVGVEASVPGWSTTAPLGGVATVDLGIGAQRAGVDPGLARSAFGLPGSIDFDGHAVAPYAGAGGQQDVSGGHRLFDGGVMFRLDGNTWQAVALAYEVTPATVLSFDFQSARQGEIHGIGVDGDLLFNNGSPVEVRFDLYGTQSLEISNHDFHDYAGPAPRHYEIPLGAYVTGPIAYLTFVNDHDVADPDAESLFSNVKLLEGPPADVLDFRGVTVRSYESPAGPQDLAGGHDVRDAGAALRLSGNTWKAVDFAYALTERTLLSFDFHSLSEAEIHGLGVDDDLSFNNGSAVEARFDLHGTQSIPASSHDFDAYGVTAPGVRHYEIPVGRYLTGEISYLTFVNDHDVTAPRSESMFSNVRVYEGSSNAVAFDEEQLVSYEGAGALQDLGGTATVQDAGQTLVLSGNTWKALAHGYDLTPATVLAFDFIGVSEGEIHGIGVDGDLVFNNGSAGEWRFDLFGTQRLASADQTFHDYSGPHVRHHAIPIGRLLTGPVAYLTFVSDHDVPEPSAVAVFSHVRLFEAVAPVVTVLPVSTADATPRLRGTVDDPAAVVTVAVAGQRHAAINQGDGTWSLPADAWGAPLAEGVHDVVIEAVGANGLTGIDDTRDELVIDTTGPRVVAVVLDSTQWAQAFRDALDPAGGRGYVVPSGSADQFLTLPWAGIDRFTFLFDEPVQAVAGDLVVQGVRAGAYGLTAFSAEADARAATWRMSGPVGTDRLRLALSDALVDLVGNPLDGEWLDGESLRSGDGDPGGVFAFGLAVAVGDANRDGLVSLRDLRVHRQTLGSSLGAAGYSLLADMTGDGRVDELDVSKLRSALGDRLPDPGPF